MQATIFLSPESASANSLLLLPSLPFIVVLVVIPVIFYFIFGQAPVTLVTWGAIAQAAMLPIISFATIYLVQTRLPKELRASWWLTGLLWLGAIVIAGFVIPALLIEFGKIMK